MKIPKEFKVRLAGNIYVDTPNLIVCGEVPILRVERDHSTGEPVVTFSVFDRTGRRQALIEGTKVTAGADEDFSIRVTEQSYVVQEESGREICAIRRCGAQREMDLDVYVLTHSPDGLFIHANPRQTNIGLD